MFLSHILPAAFLIFQYPFVLYSHYIQHASKFSQGKLGREERLRLEPLCLESLFVFCFFLQKLIKPAFKI